MALSKSTASIARADRSGFENRPCALCDGVRFDVVYQQPPDRRHWIDHPVDIVRCATCGLVQAQPQPRPATVANLYPKSYAPFAIEWTTKRAQRLKLTVWQAAYELCMLPYYARYGYH